MTYRGLVRRRELRDDLRGLARFACVPWQARVRTPAGSIYSEGFTLIQCIRGIGIAR